MATDRQDRPGAARRTRPWWRPLVISVAAASAIAALFNPLPASAAPTVPNAPANAAVPDAGSRPFLPTDSKLVMPGQHPTTPAAATATSNLTMTPVVAQREKRSAEIATLGDQLIQIGQNRDLATQQQSAADQKVAATQTALAQAHQQAAAAAANSLRDAAALPPGVFGSGLQDLDSLARIQRGDVASDQAAANQLALTQAAMTEAQAEQATASQLVGDLSAQYTALNAKIAAKQTTLQKYEAAHSDELSAADAAENAQDQQLGAQYVGGTAAGRGADPRALAAVNVALAQRGDPYVWSEEGPDQFDCSGLMWYAYHSTAAGSFPLVRVSRDQYLQTRGKVVDRYSLLPGDLLFFSYSNSWTGIHHVAMYVGNGMMVEAPRTGLDVRITPVRWTRLFQATRVYGSVDGATAGPDLGNLPPTESHHSTKPTPSHSAKPTPTPSKTTSKPPTNPTPTKSTKPTSPSAPPPTTPTASPTPTTPTTAGPPPSGGGTTKPTGGSSGGSSPSGSQSSATGTTPDATKSSSESTKPAPASKSASSSKSASTSSSAAGTASAGTK